MCLQACPRDNLDIGYNLDSLAILGYPCYTGAAIVSTYIMRGLDPVFWRRVKMKAMSKGISVRTLVLRLLKVWLENE